MKGMFYDAADKLSVTRLMFFAWGAAALFVWLVMCFRGEPKLMDVPAGLATVLVALAGAKGVEYVAERFRPPVK